MRFRERKLLGKKTTARPDTETGLLRATHGSLREMQFQFGKRLVTDIKLEGEERTMKSEEEA